MPSRTRVRRTHPQRRRGVPRCAPLGRGAALPRAARHLLGGLRRPPRPPAGRLSQAARRAGGREAVFCAVRPLGGRGGDRGPDPAEAVERLCRVGGGGGGATAAGGVDLVGRVQKLEESVWGVASAVGVLSRTVEKLSVRFRVLRRTLRDPISETATLAQKNSEATRILAAQENLLEKEIGSIQKVLYAMQEQQEKQLELILAVGEASRILDDKQDLLDAEIAKISNSTSEKENNRAKLKAETVTGGNNKP